MTQIFNSPIAREFTLSGTVAAGYTYNFYETGTDTPKEVFSDSDESTSLGSVVTLDAYGRPSSGGNPVSIFLSNTGADYKLVKKDASGAVVTISDPVSVQNSSESINNFIPRPTQYWGLTGGSSTAFTITPDTAIEDYTSSLSFILQVHATNTNTAPTLAVADFNNPGDFLTAKTIKKYNNAGLKKALLVGDLIAGERYLMTFDGTDFVVLNPHSVVQMVIENKINTQPIDATIASGAIAYTGFNTYLIGEGSTNDILDNITGGADGDRIQLKYKTGAITIRDNNVGGGNIQLRQNTIRTLAFTVDTVVFQYDAASASWLEVSSITDYDSRSYQLVGEATISDDAHVEITWTNYSYFTKYLIIIQNLVVQTDDVELRMRVSEDAGGSFKSGASDYKFVVDCSASAGTTESYHDDAESFIALSDNTTDWKLGNAAGESYEGCFMFLAPGASSRKKFTGKACCDSAGVADLIKNEISAEYLGTTNAINGLQFFASSGNLVSGTIKIWRI